MYVEAGDIINIGVYMVDLSTHRVGEILTGCRLLKNLRISLRTFRNMWNLFGRKQVSVFHLSELIYYYDLSIQIKLEITFAFKKLIIKFLCKQYIFEC